MANDFMSVMRTRLLSGALFAGAILLAGVTPLRAATIVSYSVGNWTGSTSGAVHDVDFTHITFSTYGPSGYTSSDGFTITGPDGASTSLTGLSFGGGPALKGGNDASAQIQVATPTGGQSALLFLMNSTPSSTGYSVTLSDGEAFSLAAGTTIFGVSVSHPITFATLAANPGSNLILQDVSYGNSNLPYDGGTGGGGGTSDPSAVPEATTPLLLGSGLLFLVFASRRVITA